MTILSQSLPKETLQFLTKFNLLGGQKHHPEFLITIESEKITEKTFLSSTTRAPYQAWFYIMTAWGELASITQAFKGTFAQYNFTTEQLTGLQIGFNFLKDRATTESLDSAFNFYQKKAGEILFQEGETANREICFLICNWLEFCKSYKEGDIHSCALFAYDLTHDLADIKSREAGYGNLIDTEMETRRAISSIWRDSFLYPGRIK